MPQNPFDKFRQPQKQQAVNPFDKFRRQGTAPPTPQGPIQATEADLAAQQALIDKFSQGVGGQVFTRLAEAGGNVANFYEDLKNRPRETLERIGRVIGSAGGAGTPGGVPSLSGGVPAARAAQEPRLAQLGAEAEALRSDYGKTILAGVARRDVMPRTTGGQIGNVLGSIIAAPVNVTPESLPGDIAMNFLGGQVIKGAGMAARKAISPLLQRLRAGKVRAPIEVPPIRETVVPEEIPFDPRLRREIEAGAPKSFAPSAQIRQKRGQLMPEPGSAGREVRPNPTLYDPLEAGGFYEEPAATITAPRATPALEAPALSFTDLAMSGEKPSILQKAAAKEAKTAQSPLVQPSEKTQATELIGSVVKAGLLTKPTTHLTNVGGTGLFQLSEEIANLGASILDVAVSKVNGRRSLTAPTPGTILNSIKASFESIPQMKQILKTGIDPEAAVRQELSRELNSGSRVLNGYVNGVFRLLKAEDKFFRAGAYMSNLQSRARAQAINEAKQGLIPRTEITTRAKELIDTPTEAMRADAIGDSLIAIFANENFVGRALGRVKSTPGGENIKRALDIVVPFVPTPTNLIARMLDYSPVGFTKSAGILAKSVISKAGFTQQMQRDFVKTFGRASVGSAVLTIGYKLGQAGLATGLFEGQTPGQLEREKAAGRPPGALKINGKWFPVNAFQPLGPLLAIGATLAREDKEAGKQRSFPSPAAASKQVAIRSITEQPLLEGPYNVVKAGIQTLRGKEEAYDEAAGKFVGMYVPSIVAGAAEAIDPNARQAEGFQAQIQKRVPFWRNQLPPATDALGRPLQNAGPIGAFFDPFGMRTETQNPVLQELVRLDQGLTKLGKKEDESVESYQARVTAYGNLYQEYAQQLLNNGQFINSKDDIKREALESLGRRVKEQLKQEAENRRGAAPRQVRLAPIIIMRSVLDAERKKKPGK